MNEQKITAQETGGLFFGQADGKTVCGPYMNKGMAIRQAKRIVGDGHGSTPLPTEGRTYTISENKTATFVEITNQGRPERIVVIEVSEYRSAT